MNLFVEIFLNTNHDFKCMQLDFKIQSFAIGKVLTVCIILVIIGLISSLQARFGLAITASVPPRIEERTFIYKPGLTKHYSLWFGGADKINITLEGDFARFARLQDPNPLGGPRTVDLFIELPSHEANITPGWHYVYVHATEVGPEKGMITGLASIRIQYKFLKLYPGVFITGSLSVSDIDVNQTAFFQTRISNYGSESADNVYSVITVFDVNGSYKGFAKTEASALKSGDTITLGAYFNSKGLMPGKYKAVANVFYNDENKTLPEAYFRIGVRELRVLNYTKTVEAGVPNRFFVIVQNLWNLPAENVYADITVSSENEELNFKTPSEIIPEFSVKKLDTFLDASTLSPGDKALTIKIFFEGENVLTINDVLKVVKPETREKPFIRKGSSIVFVLVLILIALLLLNILLME